MSDTAIIIIIGVVIALVIVVSLLYLAAGLVLMFTAFVMELPTIVTILMFILFPPTFIVFIVGLAFIKFGIADTLVSSDSNQVAVRTSDRDRKRIAKERAAKGYDK